MPEGTADIKIAHAYIRHALEHLYDVDALAEHWLIAQLNLTQEPARTGALRRCLIDAIQRMQPDAQESPDTPRWQMHQVLLQRYIQGTHADSLADQLGISSRHLRRIQNRAIAYLAETLFQETAKFQENAKEPRMVDPSPLSSTVSDSSDFIDNIKAVDNEIGWLRDNILSEPVSVEAVWIQALQFFAPLAKSLAIEIEWFVSSDLPKVAIHPIGLRQVMLSILTYVVEQSRVQTIVVSASASVEQVQITVSSLENGGEFSQTESSPSLLLAQRILSMFGGQLVQKQADGRYDLQVSLMTAGGTRVLVIDDNPDILQLYQRYVTGTRYQLLMCEQPGQALLMASTHSPKAIVLDIMMPGIDGWSLLGKLRHHPSTASIPLIISTIVPEQGLALALGADDFLKKPVTRALFLSALDRQLMPIAPEFR